VRLSRFLRVGRETNYFHPNILAHWGLRQFVSLCPRHPPCRPAVSSVLAFSRVLQETISERTKWYSLRVKSNSGLFHAPFPLSPTGVRGRLHSRSIMRRYGSRNHPCCCKPLCHLARLSGQLAKYSWTLRLYAAKPCDSPPHTLPRFRFSGNELPERGLETRWSGRVRGQETRAQLRKFGFAHDMLSAKKGTCSRETMKPNFSLILWHRPKKVDRLSSCPCRTAPMPFRARALLLFR